MTDGPTRPAAQFLDAAPRVARRAQGPLHGVEDGANSGPGRLERGRPFGSFPAAGAEPPFTDARSTRAGLPRTATVRANASSPFGEAEDMSPARAGLRNWASRARSSPTRRLSDPSEDEDGGCARPKPSEFRGPAFLMTRSRATFRQRSRRSHSGVGALPGLIVAVDALSRGSTAAVATALDRAPPPPMEVAGHRLSWTRIRRAFRRVGPAEQPSLIGLRLESVV